MAPAPSTLPLSPAELHYLHTSLTADPPIRPDGRSPTHFRPLIAETDLLPTANGSARVCFADGTEAIVGVKAEVEKTTTTPAAAAQTRMHGGGGADNGAGMLDAGGTGSGTGGGTEEASEEMDAEGGKKKKRKVGGGGRDDWVEIAIEIPGMRDDDALPVFLAAMLGEALTAQEEEEGGLRGKLMINRRFHWRLYIDILLLSTPLSYPLPLLSLTTHLALLTTRLPALLSHHDEDPLFNDDWAASRLLYPRSPPPSEPPTTTAPAALRPPITLLVMTVGNTILFDPTREELSVADAVLAISLAPTTSAAEPTPATATATEPENAPAPPRLRLLALRSIDPPSRLTAPGLPDSLNTATGAGAPSALDVRAAREKDGAGTGPLGQGQGQGQGSVWRAPRGGMRRGLVGRVVRMCVERGGVGEEVLAGLGGVEV